MIAVFMWKNDLKLQNNKIQLVCSQQFLLAQHTEELMAYKKCCLKWNESPYEIAVHLFFLTRGINAVFGNNDQKLGLITAKILI